jgi:hypothetical protein
MPVSTNEQESLETPAWRRLVSETEQDAMVGRLMRQKKDAEVAYATIDRKIKDIGERLENLGGKLKRTDSGGDYRDLVGFLGKVGVDASGIDDLLKERNRLASEIQEHKTEIAKLGG